MTEENRTIPEVDLNLSAKIEALLFVAPDTLSVSQLANALGITNHRVETALEELKAQYEARGIRLQQHAGRIQLVSAPEAGALVEHFLGLEATQKVSQAALETMAIVAYQQPVTRPQIDAIRGVNSDGVMRTLLSKGLVQEVGRAEGPGRPILYSTTPEFLGYFGLTSIEDLPPLNTEDVQVENIPEEDEAILKT